MVSAIATLLFWALIATVILGVVGAPWIIFVVASGLKENGAHEASLVLTRIMFPYIGLISMVSLSAGILNTYKKFAVPAFTPVLLNLSMIFSSWLLSPYFETPIYALGVGVILGGLTQLSLQIPALKKIGMLPKIGLSIQTIKNEGEKVREDIQNLIVMFIDHHLNIETVELAQVTVSVGVLCTEHWSNLKHTLEIRTCGAHLLVELWGLS